MRLIWFQSEVTKFNFILFTLSHFKRYQLAPSGQVKLIRMSFVVRSYSSLRVLCGSFCSLLPPYFLKPRMLQSLIQADSLFGVLHKEQGDQFLHLAANVVPAGQVEHQFLLESHSDGLFLVLVVEG